MIQLLGYDSIVSSDKALNFLAGLSSHIFQKKKKKKDRKLHKLDSVSCYRVISVGSVASAGEDETKRHDFFNQMDGGGLRGSAVELYGPGANPADRPPTLKDTP